MKYSIKTKVFLIILPLVAISLVLLITTVLPYRQIPRRMAGMDFAVGQAVLAGKLARALDRQLDEYHEFILSGDPEAETSLRPLEKQAEEAMAQLKGFRRDTAGKEDEAERSRFLQKIEAGYGLLAKSKGEVVLLVREGKRQRAAQRFKDEMEPLVNSLMETADLFIRGRKATFRNELLPIGNSVGVLPVLFGIGLREDVEEIALDAALIFSSDHFSREAALLLREYENSVAAGHEPRLAEARYRTRDALLSWKEQCSVNMRNEKRGANNPADFATIERLYADAEQGGTRILALVEAGKLQEAADRLEKEFSPLEASLLGSVDQLVGGKENELKKNIRRIMDDAARIQMVVGILCLVVLVIGIGSPLLLSRTIIRPIMNLKLAAESIGSGGLETRVTVTANDELGALAKAFNGMWASLGAMTDRLRDTNEQLEAKIGQLAQELAAREKTERELRESQNELNLKHAEMKELNARIIKKNQEIEAAYAELKTTHAQLLQSEKMASLGQLAAGVAHEINNPVGFISSNLNTLGKYAERLTSYIHVQLELPTLQEAIERGMDLEKLRKQIKLDYIIEDLPQLIHESMDGAERIKKIVQDLKAFSRKDEEKLERVDINNCLDSTLNIVWNELKYKATVNKEYGEIPLTTCCPGQLSQVFMNLLVNAGHAIDKEGTITVKSWHEEGSVHVAISDTGCGIPEDIRARIFEPFFTTKEVGKGTGLGLSISHDIVKKHGGEMRMASEVGKGTTFTVIVPTGGPELPAA